MSRSVSGGFRQAVFSQTTNEVFVVLITITSNELDNPIYIACNSQTVYSRGETYVPLPVQLILPDDQPDSTPRARVSICNISRDLTAAIRQITLPPTITFEVVMASTPDTVEAAWEDMTLTNIRYDDHVIEGEIGYEGFLQEPMPAGIFTPVVFPGMF